MVEGFHLIESRIVVAVFFVNHLSILFWDGLFISETHFFYEVRLRRFTVPSMIIMRACASEVLLVA